MSFLQKLIFQNIYQYSTDLLRSHVPDSKIILWEEKLNSFVLTCESNDVPADAKEYLHNSCITLNLFSNSKSFTNKSCVEFQSFSAITSVFNLHKMTQDEAFKHYEDIKRIAPLALIVDYESPERNLNYLPYGMLCALKNLTLNSERQKKFNVYMKNGAMEGFLFNLGDVCHVLMQKRFHFGTIGVFLVRWI